MFPWLTPRSSLENFGRAPTLQPSEVLPLTTSIPAASGAAALSQPFPTDQNRHPRACVVLSGVAPMKGPLFRMVGCRQTPRAQPWYAVLSSEDQMKMVQFPESSVPSLQAGSMAERYVFLAATPSSSDGKESACNMRDLGLIPGLGSSLGEGKGYPLQYCGLENSMDYSPWGCKELDTAEQFHFR